MSLEIKHRIRRQTVWICPLRSNIADYVGSVTYWGWPKTEYPKLPWDGLHLEEGKEAGQKPPGGGQWWKSWRRWVFHGAKHRPKHGAGLYGEVLLRSYVPDGMKRMSESECSARVIASLRCDFSLFRLLQSHEKSSGTKLTADCLIYSMPFLVLCSVYWSLSMIAMRWVGEIR